MKNRLASSGQATKPKTSASADPVQQQCSANWTTTQPVPDQYNRLRTSSRYLKMPFIASDSAHSRGLQIN